MLRRSGQRLMQAQQISLNDKYERESGRILMNGTQTLLRVAIERRKLDVQNRLKTYGVFTGYRGSPLAGLDIEISKNAKILSRYNIRLEQAVNEELGATIAWGTQKIPTKTGVFSLFYAKGPGIDRASDVLRTANATGTSRNGGCLAICGDDLSAKSSTMCNQSNFALQHFEIPILDPADLQDVLDLGVHGLEMSRFSGAWVGLLATADVVDSSSIVQVGTERFRGKLIKPSNFDPRRIEGDFGGINRLLRADQRGETERLTRHVRLPAALRYARANLLDGVRWGDSQQKAPVMLVTTGTTYLRALEALKLLGIEQKDNILCIYKVSMPWPLDTESLLESVHPQTVRLLALEHKRAFIEPQLKAALFGTEKHFEVWGKTRTNGEAFMSDLAELEVHDIVYAIIAATADVLPETYHKELKVRADACLQRVNEARTQASASKRSPFFCSGCPHATSTKIPQGSEAFAGIGCHLMAEHTGDATLGLSAMGGEGVAWIGMAPHLQQEDKSTFVNLGDGTYYHSGSLAIRQALLSKSINVTFKILFNEAVAMTGGQSVPMDVGQLVKQVRAEGVQNIVVISEHNDLIHRYHDILNLAQVYHRDALAVQQQVLAKTPGVNVLIYDQACAIEKRRRMRKLRTTRKEQPPPSLFINHRVCEGCNDCSVQSQCISLEPLETPYGQKRKINQSLCNKDYSCVKGFCPAFVWVEGSTSSSPIKNESIQQIIEKAVTQLPTWKKSDAQKETNILIAGIGGLGVTTVSAVLALAAYINGKHVTTVDVTGLAQKNGPVTSHLRIFDTPVVSAPKVPVGSLDTLIAADKVVACSKTVLETLNAKRTLCVANTKIMPTADFVTKGVADWNAKRLTETLENKCERTQNLNAANLAETLLGDVIYSNMVCIGAAAELGGLRLLTPQAIEHAITLHGVAVTSNLAAFRAGRLFVNDKEVLDKLMEPSKKWEDALENTASSLDERISYFSKELEAYQDKAYADLYRRTVATVKDHEGDSQKNIAERVALSLFKTMAYKDEYEVARLYLNPSFRDEIRQRFGSEATIAPVLAPPLISPTDPATNRPKKRTFRGEWWLFPLFRLLHSLKGLRGTRFDFLRLIVPERKADKDFVDMVFEDVKLIVRALDCDQPLLIDLLLELAALPSTVKGFGPVKEKARETALSHRKVLRERIEAEINQLK